MVADLRPRRFRQLAGLARQVGRGGWPQVERKALAVLQDDPSNEVALHYLAVALEELGDDQRAIGARLRLHSLCPTDFTNLRSLGLLLWRQGEVSRARDFLRLAVEQVPRPSTTLPRTLRFAMDLVGRIVGRPGLGTRAAQGLARSEEAELRWAAETRRWLDDIGSRGEPEGAGPRRLGG